MPNSWFQFKQFIVQQERCAMKVTTEACLFGAWAVAKLQHLVPKKGRALDIGTGTGLLSLMIAQELQIEIDAVEVEEGAIQDAGENFSSSAFRERLHLHHTAIQEFSAPTQYELIISNPPFYSNSLKAHSSSKNLARHDEGLDLDDLFLSVKSLQRQDGFVALLYPAFAADLVIEKASGIGLKLWATAMVHQTPTHAAFRTMYVFNAAAPSVLEEETIIIKNNRKEYSEDFTRLLGPFYLRL